MADSPPETKRAKVVLMYYSPKGRQSLEAVLHRHNLKVFSVDGRAADAVDMLRKHPAEVVVVDHGADDVSLSQAIRQVCQILPGSLVVAAYPNREEVGIYQGGRRIGVAESLEAALRQHAYNLDPQ